jgi:hypothetical protein
MGVCRSRGGPAGTLPYKVAVKLSGAIVRERPVISIAEGEAQIAAALRRVGGCGLRPAGRNAYRRPALAGDPSV